MPKVHFALPPVPIIVPKPVIIIMTPPLIEPEHPFQNAKDAAYLLPNSRNVEITAKVTPAKATTLAYKTLPLIHDPSITHNVFKRAMEAQVTITQCELLLLSPEVCAWIREDTTMKGFPLVLSLLHQGFCR